MSEPEPSSPPGWTLHLGDCLPWLRSLPDKSVDHVIMDPPYSEHVHKVQRQRRTDIDAKRGDWTGARNVDLGFAHMEPEVMAAVAVECSRVVRRWVVTFSDLELAPSWRSAFVDAGLTHKRTAVWHRVNGSPQFSGDRPAEAVEAITLAHVKGRSRWNGGGKQGIYSFTVVRGERLHTTPKPLDLMLALVSDFTDPGELIVDPFAGSGTTGVAALRLGRRFAGAEQDPTHHETACARLAAEARGQTLTQARTGQLSLIG